MQDIINKIDFRKLYKKFKKAKPFPHIVIDNFFKEDVALQLEKDMPDFDDDIWCQYNNAIEKKKTCNHWDRFPETTYQVLAYLNSKEFTNELSDLTGVDNLYVDIGLNGGGWHMHGRGGKLNVHLDYSIHPKLKLERRLNLIIYLASDWQEKWGGELGLWTHDADKNQPKECVDKIWPKFNRAVIFDTTCNSWHGLPEEIMCPEGSYRKSLAVYYLSVPRAGVSTRGKALFAPFGVQVGDDEVLELIDKRADVDEAWDVCRNKDNI